jgi:hypothetical protein
MTSVAHGEQMAFSDALNPRFSLAPANVAVRIQVGHSKHDRVVRICGRVALLALTPAFMLLASAVALTLTFGAFRADAERGFFPARGVCWFLSFHQII